MVYNPIIKCYVSASYKISAIHRRGRIVAAKQGSLKATITVAMSNYLEAGSIVAGAGGLTLWMEYLNLNDAKLGLIGALSANGFVSAIGAFLGGILVDKYG